MSAGLEVFVRQIVRKNSHSGICHSLAALVAVETDHVGRDHIKFWTQVGQGLIGFDSPDFPLHAEQFDHFAKSGFLIDIDSERVVTEILADVEEIAGAAADIENSLSLRPGRAQIANAPKIDFHPYLDVEILGPCVPWILSLHGVDRLDGTFPRSIVLVMRAASKPQRRAADQCLFNMTPRTGISVTSQYFLEFVGKLHDRDENHSEKVRCSLRWTN